MDVGPFKKITKEDYNKIQLLTGTITQVKKHPESTKYYVLLVETPVQDEDYQIVAEMTNYTMADLLGKQIVIVGNMKPEKIQGIESQARILVTHKNKKPVLIVTDKKVPAGTKAYALSAGTIGYKN